MAAVLGGDFAFEGVENIEGLFDGITAPGAEVLEGRGEGGG